MALFLIFFGESMIFTILLFIKLSIGFFHFLIDSLMVLYDFIWIFFFKLIFIFNQYLFVNFCFTSLIVSQWFYMILYGFFFTTLIFIFNQYPFVIFLFHYFIDSPMVLYEFFRKISISIIFIVD